MHQKVPFNDLKGHHKIHRQSFHDALDQLLDSSNYIGGAALQEFEKNFAAFCESSYAVGTGNGTDALILSLKALNIGPGDSVVTVPNTFIATSEAITAVGADIIFVDVCAKDLTLDLQLLDTVLTTHPKKDSIRAVIPVHIHGQPANLPALQKMLTPRGIACIADAAQAHGARINGVSITQFPDISTFSFYPGKTLAL